MLDLIELAGLQKYFCLCISLKIYQITSEIPLSECTLVFIQILCSNSQIFLLPRLQGWCKEDDLIGRLLFALDCQRDFPFCKLKVKKKMLPWLLQAKSGMLAVRKVSSPLQHRPPGFAGLSMPIFCRACEELWPGSEGSLVAKNVFFSLKILAHITVFFFLKLISSVWIVSRVRGGKKIERKLEYIH